MDTVKATLLSGKSGYGRQYSKGDVVDIHILEDGRARIVMCPSLYLLPSEYRLYIPQEEFDKLLNHGDMV